jgi:hypothetical protein
MEEEEEEEDRSESLSFEQIENLAAQTSQSLHLHTGVSLPKLTWTPLEAAHRVEYVPLRIELPLGSLFYPSCGSDIEHAMREFGPYVIDCHFADPYWSVRGRPRRLADLKRIDIPGIETVVVGGGQRRQIDNASSPAYSHEKDGLLTLLEDIRLLSVFYYRGDSPGEGGSNQRWLQPVLFHTVLARLLDGGLIATDGSNCGSGHRGQDVPWRALCHWSPPQAEPFVYAGREFRFVGELKDPAREPSRTVRLWQVRSIPSE